MVKAKKTTKAASSAKIVKKVPKKTKSVKTTISKKKVVPKTKSKKATNVKSNVNSKKRIKKSKDYKPLIFGIIGILLLLVIIGAAVILIPKTVEQTDVVVAAKVNGVEISMDQLNKQYLLLPDQYRASLTKPMVLQQLVDEELLLQYGKEKGIEVTGEEVQEEIQSIMDQGSLTLEDLQSNLDQFNLTIEDFESLVERKIYIERSMDLLLSNLPEIPGTDVSAYYEANIDSYKVPDQVKVRHILIRSTVENAAQLAKSLMDQVKAGEDFCGFVTEYSDDSGSKETCGEYTFARGMMVPEFEEASFKMAPGDLTVVNTQFGYHVIEKLEDIPATTKSLEDVQDGIIKTLAQNAQVKAYQDFLSDAKTNTEIEILYTE